jgi:hypothetical protein
MCHIVLQEVQGLEDNSLGLRNGHYAYAYALLNLPKITAGKSIGSHMTLSDAKTIQLQLGDKNEPKRQ